MMIENSCFDVIKNPIIKEDMESIYCTRKNWDEFRGKTVYITGSTGMLASYIILFLIYLNEVQRLSIKIIAGMRNEKKAKRIFGYYMDKEYFDVYKNNILDTIDNNLKFDYIIHAASLASPQYYGKMPVETILPNVIGSYVLLEYARKHKVNGFLFFSSGDVYGTIKNKNIINENAIGSINHLDLGSFYGESKRCGESLCRAYYLEYKVPAKFARIAHTYGPTMDWKHDTRVFSEFVKNIIQNENILMKSDGSAKRPFCYITDTISALLKILLDGQNGEAYNVGNDDAFISIRDLANTLVRIFPEKHLKVEFANRVQDGYVSCSEKKYSTLSMDKLRKLEWDAKVSVADGFKRTIRAIQLENS